MTGIAASVVTSWTPAALAAAAGITWSGLVMLRSRTSPDVGQASEFAVTSTSVSRLLPLDAMRGTIMALMAIDHASLFVRRWHPFEIWDQPLPDYPSLSAVLTRLVTHPCAPGFYFLMGAGMLLFVQARRKAGWSERRIAGQLALRGLLFIALEQLIVDLATSGRPAPLEFSILAGLGGTLLIGIPLVRLTPKAQAIAGATILLVMQLLPGWMLHADLGLFTAIRLLLLPGSVGPVFVLYPPVPWLGVTLLGMAFAGALLVDAKKTYRLALIGGLSCLVLFPLLRALGGFGNLRMPAGHSLIDFLNVVKYPPSLTFLLLSLGIDLVLLGIFAHAADRWTAWVRPLVALGQAALYFFLTHWFVYAAMGSVFLASRRPAGHLPRMDHRAGVAVPDLQGVRSVQAPHAGGIGVEADLAGATPRPIACAWRAHSMTTEAVNTQGITRRAYLAAISAVALFCVMFFAPAGTFAYWQAWAYMGVVLIPMLFVMTYMLRKAPELLARRLQMRERERTQKRLIGFSTIFLLGAFLVPGFDRRWSWSSMPWWVVVAADLLVLLGYAIIFRVFRENQYTSRTVQVEQGQQIVSTGPYAVVRHPMYVGVLFFYLASPIALGSWWAFLPAVIVLPILVIRILNEEQVLERDLPGYTEYKQKTRYRLIPGIW